MTGAYYTKALTGGVRYRYGAERLGPPVRPHLHHLGGPSMEAPKMDDGFRIVNWDRFQHYTKRNPPWIKLHYEILSSADWVTLSDASRVLAIACMLIASRNNGLVPSNKEYIKRVAYLNKAPDFAPLVSCGFLVPCGGALAGASMMQADASVMQADATSESEAESEAETEPPKPPKGGGGLVLEYWNERYRRKIESAGKIEAVLRRGASIEDCKLVIDFKSKEWLNTDFAKFLQPSTLFAPTKFWDYLSAAKEGEAATRPKPKIADTFVPGPEITPEDRAKSEEYLKNLTKGVGNWD